MSEKYELGRVVSIWKGEDGWCVAGSADITYVYQTLRSALRKVEFLLKSFYQEKDANEPVEAV